MQTRTIVIIIAIICIILCSCSSSIALGGGYLYSSSNETTTDETTTDETTTDETKTTSTKPASTTPASTTPASTTPASTTPASTTPTSTTPVSNTKTGAVGSDSNIKTGAVGVVGGSMSTSSTKVQGYSSNSTLVQSPNTIRAIFPTTCRDFARREPGYVAWGHRNNTHPDPNLKNTCFFYASLQPGYKGDSNDTVHVTGCPYDFQSVESGCKPRIDNVRNTDAVKCKGGSGAVFRFINGQLRGYPSPEIASSWDPNWGSAKEIECSGIPVGSNLSLAPPLESVSVKCKQYPGSVFRYTNGQLRGYPSPEIASSWSPNWGSAKEIDCSGIPVGANLNKSPGKKSIACSGDSSGKIYLYTGGAKYHYPTPEIAATWDPLWSLPAIVDCSGIPDKDTLDYQNPVLTVNLLSNYS